MTESCTVKIEAKSRAWDGLLELFTGLALGLAIGALTGLSITSVVGQVVIGLIALIAAFLGLVPTSDGPTSLQLVRGLPRLRTIGLSVGILAGASAGIWARTHQVLAPSLADQAQEWRNVGVPKDEIWRLVVMEKFGTLHTENLNSQGSKPGILSGVLFDGEASVVLWALDPDDPANDSAVDWLNRMAQARNPAWRNAAEQLRKLEGDHVALRTALTAVWIAMRENYQQNETRDGDS